MVETFSMQNPLFFGIWMLIHWAFYYVIVKSMKPESTYKIFIPCALMATAGLFNKFFDEVTFTVCVCICAVILIATLFLVKQNIFRTLADIFIPHLLMFIAGILTDLIQIIGFGESVIAKTAELPRYHTLAFVFYFSIVSLPTFALLFSGIIKIIKHKKKDYNQFKFPVKYIFFLWLPCTHILEFILMYRINVSIIDKLEENSLTFQIDTSSMFLMLSVVVFVFDLLTFAVVERFERIERNNQRYEQELFKYRLDYQQTVLLKENQKEIRKMRHDMMNILSTAQGFIEVEKYDKASGILKSATKDLISLKGASVCSDDTLNTILSIKSQNAEEKGVRLNCKVSEDAPILIDDYSLCRVIGNLADNAINAVKESDSDTVNISVEITNESLKIITENKFDKSKEKTVVKNENRGHGRGIILEIVKKFDGSYIFKADGDIYTTVTVLKNIDSGDSDAEI